MLMETSQIQKWLSRRYNLKIEGEGFDTRLVGDVPDCEHLIPVGVHQELCLVRVSDKVIRLLAKADITDMRTKLLSRIRYWLDFISDPNFDNMKLNGEKVCNLDFSKLAEDDLLAILEKAIQKNCRRS